MVSGKTTRELLVDSVMKNNSLAEVISYISNSVTQSVLIVDNKGRIDEIDNLEEMLANFPMIEGHYLLIPEIDWENRHYYLDQQSNIFYFRIGEEELEGYIVIRDVTAEDLPHLIPTLSETAMAVRMYFYRLNAVLRTQNKYKKELLNDLLLDNVSSVKEIIKKINYEKLDFSQVYYVSIFMPETDIDINTLYTYSNDWLKFNNLDVICSIWLESSIVFICPSYVNDKTLEVDFSWTKSLANIERFKREINKRFHITSILGIGQKYPLINLNKSYQEAKTALTIARLMGQSDFIKHYKDLGVYRLLYMQDTETLKTFVDHTIHDLVEYDKYHDCELLKTLRVLFNSNMNWTTAAKTLYIHVNTLRYRISKINELLKVDINTLETQINLCIALKLMDSLKDNEFME